MSWHGEDPVLAQTHFSGGFFLMQTCSKIFRSLTIAAIFVFFAAAIGHRAMAEIVLPATHSVQKIPLAVYPGGDGAFAPGDPDTLYFGGG